MRLTRRRDLKNVIDPAQANLFDSPEVAVEAHRALLTPDQIWNSIDAQSLVESHEDKRNREEASTVQSREAGSIYFDVGEHGTRWWYYCDWHDRWRRVRRA